ncbi:hypothetical protein N7G274_000844 [Stereocaulon virgatum]|uniref:CMP/dCMP-type deaminase domain-containing protein n=1 Tax=Stereocaulon virgatum TaxID=373712 RepID=A0ABR4AMU9_9LECA
MADHSPVAPRDHEAYMRYALSFAKKAPPKPTNFCVGAVLVDEAFNHILSTGHTMELPGNTHAEQCCLAKYEDQQASKESKPIATTSQKLVLYTTMEPCNKRASGNIPCTETILKSKRNGNAWIQTVYVGVEEPEKFIGENTGRAKLEEAGIEYVHVPGLEDEILAIATAGHEKE